MAFLDGFDASKVDPNEPMQPIPAGTYLAMIVTSERKENKNKTGQLLKLEFSVCEGKYKGRKVREHLNLWHPDDTTRKIAWGDMSAICRAVGIMVPNDSTDLHNVPLEITVGVTNPNAEGKIYNEITGYQKRGASAAGSVVQTSAPVTIPGAGSAAPAAPAGERPGWMG